MRKVEKHKKPKNIGKFIHEVTPMVWKLVNKYYFPKVDREDMADACLSVVLTKTLKKFKNNNRASFKTFYYWQLRSFLSNKWKYYHAAKRKGQTFSIFDTEKYVKLRGAKINLQNLIFGKHNFKE